MTAQHSNEITTSERLNEIAQILASGLTRMYMRQSSELSGEFGESSLHISPDQSGHSTAENRRMADG
jgi:hypothetical protein